MTDEANAIDIHTSRSFVRYNNQICLVAEEVISWIRYQIEARLQRYAREGQRAFCVDADSHVLIGTQDVLSPEWRCCSACQQLYRRATCCATVFGNCDQVSKVKYFVSSM